MVLPKYYNFEPYMMKSMLDTVRLRHMSYLSAFYLWIGTTLIQSENGVEGYMFLVSHEPTVMSRLNIRKKLYVWYPWWETLDI